MTTLATLLVVAFFGYLIYHFAPRRDERAFRLERFHPGAPMSDALLSYYDDQRRYSDLVAIHGRGDVPDQDLPNTESATTNPGAPPASTSVRPGQKSDESTSVQRGGSARKGVSPPTIHPADPTAEPLTTGAAEDRLKASFG